MSAHTGRWTLDRARKELASLDMSIRKTDGEYRVTFRGVTPDFAEQVAYYTNDIDDAVETGRAMAKKRDKV